MSTRLLVRRLTERVSAGAGAGLDIEQLCARSVTTGRHTSDNCRSGQRTSP